MKYDQQIISLINDMSKYYSPHQVFSDWVEMYAISISNACTLLNSTLKQSREQKYLEIKNKYKEVEQNRFPELCGMLIMALDDDVVDILGNVYMGLESGSKHTGQFFTPNQISRLTARLMPPVTDADGIIRFTEPTSGSAIEGFCKRLGEKAGVRNVHPHRFRRTCATMALKRGMPVEQVSKMLGHEDLKTTQIYLDLDERNLEIAHEKYVV